jgi:predicted regulator of Ras-like GTPase activity (Roadblock/LC7/MglB family)
MGGKPGAGSLKSILADFVNIGQYQNAFIADENGLPLVFAGENTASSDTQAAVLARIKKTIEMVDSRKGLGEIEEMVFDVNGRKKIVCRNFIIKNHHLILAITIESHRSYRRLTNSLVHKLQSIWDL